MSRVVIYVFDSLFERKESVSDREKGTVVIVAGILLISTIVALVAIG